MQTIVQYIKNNIADLNFLNIETQYNMLAKDSIEYYFRFYFCNALL